MSAQGQSPIDAKGALGQILRTWRASAELTTQQVADGVGCKEPTYRTWERGRSSPDLRALRALFEFHEVPVAERPELERLHDAATRRAAKASWGKVISESVKRLLKYEAAADEICCFHSTLVYGPAQTRATAGLVLASSGRSAREIEKLIDARVARLDVLKGADAPRLRLIILESVLYMDHGAPEVLQEQLLHLVHLVREHRVEVHVLPLVSAKRGYLPVSTSFVWITTRGKLSVVQLENQTDSIFVEDPERVAVYEHSFGVLLEAALSVDESVRLLSKVASGTVTR